MRFLPFERLTFDSAEPPEVIRRRLKDQVDEPRPRLPWATYERKLEGQVAGSAFKMWEISGWGSFGRVPILCGRIEPGGMGSVAHVLIRPHHMVNAFVAVWFALTIPGAVLALVGGMAGESALVRLGAPLVGYAFWAAPVWYRRVDSLRLLRGLFA